jgi:hypothetical protein
VSRRGYRSADAPCAICARDFRPARIGRQHAGVDRGIPHTSIGADKVALGHGPSCELFLNECHWSCSVLSEFTHRESTYQWNSTRTRPKSHGPPTFSVADRVHVPGMKGGSNASLPKDPLPG